MKELLEDIKLLKTINDAYKYLESNIEKLEINHNVTDFWVHFRNQTDDTTEKQIAQWELECFMFQIVDTRVFSFSYSTGENPGDVFEYPKLDEHQKEAFEYVKKRAEKASHPILKARYNHLLWRAIKGVKNAIHAKKAIDAYFELLNSKNEKDKINDENNNQILSRKCKVLVSAVSETKYKVDETVQLVRDLILKDNHLKFYIKHSLLEVMLKFSSIFKPDSFTDTLSIFEGEVDISDSQKTDDFAMVNYYLPTAIKVASKLKSDEKIWYSKIGECYLRMGDGESELERNWIKQQHYAKAIQNFKLAKNLESKTEAEEKYASLKDEVTLPTSVFEYNDKQIAELKEIEEEIKKETKELIKLPSNVIYERLAKAKYLPSSEKIKESSKNFTEPWLRGISTTKFDINKNIENISSEDEDGDGWMLQYQYHIRHYATPYLYYILIPGIRSRKLTFKNFIEFLHTYTWIGFTLVKKDLGGQKISYNWISMIAPSVQEYFHQMEACLLDEEYKPNFMLAIDGLTIKFEGLFREFCARIKVPTITSNSTGTQEMYLHQLLKHPTIVASFSGDDRHFFEFLFTKENGLNLRNNVAHCYFDYSDYSYGYFHLLLAALLRLAKYNFKVAKND